MAFEISVQVKRAGGFQEATLRFGADADIGRIRNWKDFLAADATSTAKEAADYAQESITRWEKHRAIGRVATGPDDFSSLILAKPDEDIALLLVVEADWWQANDLFGFAYLRRTWTGSLYMEYLAKHPMTTYSDPPDLKVSGLIEAVLVGLASLIDSIREDHRPAWVWWESTKGSAKVYEKFFAPTIPNDLVIVSAKELAGCHCQIIHQVWPDKDLHGSG